MRDTTLESDGASTESLFELFREDSFDPVTQTRRGRIYTARNLPQPYEWTVIDPGNPSLDWKQMGNQSVQCCRLFTYRRDPLDGVRNAIKEGKLPKLLIGQEPFLSLWRIVAIEGSIFGTPILTLRPIQSLGDIPELNLAAASPEAQRLAREAWSDLQACVYRGGPSDRIDRCRGLLSVILGDITGDLGRDLGKSIAAWENQSPEDNKGSIVSHAGKIVARLHSRTKPNEQHAKDLPPPTDDDAQLAIKCVAFVMTELGWAK